MSFIISCLYRTKIPLVLFCLFLCNLAFAASPSSIQTIEARSIDANNTLLKIHFIQSKPSVHYFTLTGPPRFVLDIKNGQSYPLVDNKAFTGTLIQSLRQGQQPDHTWRLSFNLNTDVKVTQFLSAPQVITIKLTRKIPMVEDTSTAQPLQKTSAQEITSTTKSDKITAVEPNPLIEARSIDANNTLLKIHFIQSKPSVHYFVLTGPPRFVLDIKDGQSYPLVDNKAFTSTLIQSLRQGQQPDHTWRLSFNLNADVKVTQFLSTHQEITIKLTRKTPIVENTSTAPAIAPIATSSATSTTAEPATPSSPITKSDKITAAELNTLNAPSTPFNVQFSLQQDSMLGVVGQVKSSVNFNDSQAGAVELDGGSRVVRINGTYGFALNDDNRIKLTGEYLLENLDFDFYSGDTRQWVDQGAAGIAYQYLLDKTHKSVFQDIEIGTHYSHAPSKNLSAQTLTYTDGTTVTDYRRIAGGNDWNGTAQTSMRLWPKSLLTIGGDYDKVRYDTQYCTHNGGNAQGFGGHAALDQLLTQNTKAEINSTVSQLFNTYGGELDWIFTSTHTATFSTGFNLSYTQDHTTERNFWINGINLNVVWDEASKTNKGTFSEPELAVQSLGTWVQTPAVRMPDVLTITDECVKTNKESFIPIQSVCPSGGSVEYNGSDYYASGGWYQYYLQSPTSQQAQIIQFDSANIIGTPSGEVACLYILNGRNTVGNNRLILKNQTFNRVKYTQGLWYTGSYSQYWPPSQQPTPNFMCPGTPQSCLFETVPSG